MITRAQALKTLKSLKPASVFIQCYQEDELPHDLDSFFSVPEEFFSFTSEEQEVFTKGRLIPILDDGNFDLVLFYDPEDQSFVLMDVEEGDVDAKFANWQQFVAHLMIRIAECADDDDSELKAIAKTVGFKYLREFKTFMKSLESETDDDDDESEEDERRKRTFIESLTG